MKKYIAIAVVLVLLSSALAFGGCKKEQNTEKSYKTPDVFKLDVENYISLGEYKELTIAQTEGKSKGEAVWEAVVERSEVISYPDELVDYYFDQLTEQYKYYAEQSGKSMREVLADHGMTEDSLVEQARKLTKDDLVLAAIIMAEGITLTDEDVSAHFDKFVEQYVAVYGYTEEYVKENLSDVVLDSMLHDKTIEFLIINNHFE